MNDYERIKQELVEQYSATLTGPGGRLEIADGDYRCESGDKAWLVGIEGNQIVALKPITNGGES